ncbi:uncharacterized protein LOC6049605 [Culex quinquefasciatus]|uniref:uncharacterized protein LOC6049605 n=1 Tax=Culex quinquefasciatus TaxID=7176 RepID=UPI0018E30B71|nr:uncharacterized protein LOC6049605 [Culex quinquefasciatus]
MKRSPSSLELAWPPGLQHVVFRELGWHCGRDSGRNIRVARTNLAKACQADPEAGDCHLRRAVTELGDLNVEAALENCRNGLAVDGFEEDFGGVELEGRILFERGDFEEHARVTFNRMELLVGHRRKQLEAEWQIAVNNYENILGRKAGGCLYELRGNIARICNRQAGDHKKDHQECDVVSLQEEEHVEAHIRKEKKLQKDTRMLGQLYLGKTWKDLEFLQSLRGNGHHGNVVRLSGAKESSESMSNTIEECYQKVSHSLHQLQSRTPVYTLRNKRFGSKQSADSYTQENLFKWRYKTYRDVYNQLDRMHELREQRNLPELLKFAEDTLWNYYQIKTKRVFPDQFKFTAEVCNLVGLAVLDQLEVPLNLMDDPLEDRLRHLFHLPPLRETALVVPLFGDKSTFRDPAAPDKQYLSYRNRRLKLEHRLHHSKYPIERALLYHALAQTHLDGEQLDTARIMAGSVMRAAQEAGSNLWFALGTLQLVAADCLQRNVEKLARSLTSAAGAASALKCHRLRQVIHVARIINDELISKKKKKRDSQESQLI